MDNKKYDKGYRNTLKIINGIDLEDENLSKNTLRFISTLDRGLKNVDMFLGAKDAFKELTRIEVNKLICLASPITMITRLRMLGLSDLIFMLMSSSDSYDSRIPVSKIKFSDMFQYDDRSMVQRALVGYIMEIPEDSYPLTERFIDLKTTIWNKCLEIASQLKNKYTMFASTGYSELTSAIIDCSYGDSIGNEKYGIDVFYNKFIGINVGDLVGSGESDVYSTIVDGLSNIGSYIVSQLDYFWDNYVQRLMLYMRLKIQLFRLHPELDERWSYIDNQDIYIEGGAIY